MAAIATITPGNVVASYEHDALGDASAFAQAEPGTILDIGGSKLALAMKPLLEEKLFAHRGKQLIKNGGKKQHLLPSVLLSDKRGLALWRSINRLPHYYQTRDEIELFEKCGSEIAKHVQDNTTIIDLGSGDVRKIRPFLDILESRHKRIRYCALDLDQESLKEGLKDTGSCSYNWVQCYGLWGSFNQSLDWLQHYPGPKLFCSLGSILGNDWFDPSVANLGRFSVLMGQQDKMLVGMDSCKDKNVVWASYHDEQGLFESFIRNGLEHSNRVLGHDWYRCSQWQVTGLWHDNPFMHQFAITATEDVICEPINLNIRKGTQIDCYEAFKYDSDEMRTIFTASGLVELGQWRSSSQRIVQYMLGPHQPSHSI